MREIFFRGKRLDNGEWVSSGNLITFNDEGEGKQFFIPQMNAKCTCTHDEQDNIISFDSGMFYKVDPETIGQFTGLTDKNGKKIFEGDVVLYPWSDQDKPQRFTIKFKDGQFVASPVKETEEYWDFMVGGYSKEMEIIGNIHDNPELLGGVEDG